MTKYKLSKQELQDHWDDQIRFIQKSIKEFDRGDEKEAQRLATHLRVLFHETLLDLMVSPEGIKYNAKSNNQSRCFF